MRFEVEQLTPAGRRFEHTYAAGELPLEDERARLSDGAKVAGRISRKGAEVRVEGRLTGSVEVSCDRCLKPVAVPVEVEFEELFVPAGADAPMKDESAGLRDEEMSLAVYSREELDIDELVREQVLLALPARHVCDEACKGLCPHCGADLNARECDCAGRSVDPRWAGLAALKDRDS